MAKKTGFDALMQVVCAEWCLGSTMEGRGEISDVTRFIPHTGTVTADQFVDWVFLASGEEANDGTPKWRRAREAIRAAFVLHMGGAEVDAATLRGPSADGGQSRLPLPDPEAFARNLTDTELVEYRETFGEESREWQLAQSELARRRRSPSWLRALGRGMGLIAVIIVARHYSWL